MQLPYVPHAQITQGTCMGQYVNIYIPCMTHCHKPCDQRCCTQMMPDDDGNTKTMMMQSGPFFQDHHTLLKVENF